MAAVSQLRILETGSKETEGTGRDSAFIPSRKFKSRSQEAAGWIESGPIPLPDVS